jgi:hypothetical protein
MHGKISIIIHKNPFGYNWFNLLLNNYI